MRKYRCLILCLLLVAFYGLGRFYFHLTAGFSIAAISSNLSFNPDWETRSLDPGEREELYRALNQKYHYLGKGIQSFVFESEDGQYVIKFMKYKHYRLSPWITYLPPLPALIEYRKEKEQKKRDNLDAVFRSWKLAFEELHKESGLLFVHTNKTKYLQSSLILIDNMGIEHSVNLDDMEFCIQKKATLLCKSLIDLQSRDDLDSAKLLLDRLLYLIISEYKRGIADTDHTLMQNTGVVNGSPFHIDVGQFVADEKFKDPIVMQEDIFSKTQLFYRWLEKEYPPLAEYLDKELQNLIGKSHRKSTLERVLQ